MTGAPLPATDPRALRRLQAAEHRATHGDYRTELRAAIAKLQPSIMRRRAELAVDEALLAQKVAELVVLDEEGERAAAAFAPLQPLFIPLKQAAHLAGCSTVTMKKICRQHDFGWNRGGRWWVAQDELMAHLANVDHTKD